MFLIRKQSVHFDLSLRLLGSLGISRMFQYIVRKHYDKDSELHIINDATYVSVYVYSKRIKFINQKHDDKDSTNL